MKKIINAPENYVDDMLKGIYAAHSDEVKYTADDLRCYCRAEKKDGKVAIITGGGSGHLPGILRRALPQRLRLQAEPLPGVLQGDPDRGRRVPVPLSGADL